MVCVLDATLLRGFATVFVFGLPNSHIDAEFELPQALHVALEVELISVQLLQRHVVALAFEV